MSLQPSQEEFEIYIRETREIINSRLTDMLGIPIYVLKSNARSMNNANNCLKYIPPRSGVLRMDIIDGMRRKKTFKFLSEWDCTKICVLTKGQQDMCRAITWGIKLLKLRLAEAICLFHVMENEKTVTRVKLLAAILPHLDTPTECRKFLSQCTDDDKLEIQNVKKIMGYSMRIMLGTYDGMLCC